MDIQDEQKVITYVGGKAVYSGTWGDAPEDVKALYDACDWYILDSIEQFDIIMVAQSRFKAVEIPPFSLPI